MEPRLKTKYNEDIKKNMMSTFNYKSLMQIPKLQKICINQGVGKAVADKKLIDAAIVEMTSIAGQKAVATYSKKDISNFKLRKGMPIGVKVTLVLLREEEGCVLLGEEEGLFVLLGEEEGLLVELGEEEGC